MFEYISSSNTREAIAGVYFALRCINYREYSERLKRLKSADAIGETTSSYDRELGLKIIEEIERAERAPLESLTDSKAEEYKRKLARIVRDLTKGTIENDRDRGARLLDEWRKDAIGNIGFEELSTYLSRGGVIALGISLVAIALLLGLFSFLILTGRYLPSDNKVERFMLSAALMGGLGSSIHTLRSFFWYVGNRLLRTSWALLYFIQPFIGMALALIFSLMILGITGVPEDVRIFYWGGAVSALIGMFSDAAIRKLREVSHTLFRIDGSPKRLD